MISTGGVRSDEDVLAVPGVQSSAACQGCCAVPEHWSDLLRQQCAGTGACGAAFLCAAPSCGIKRREAP
eukprot:11227032-Lingulodinium_polyedra.AAC.1